MFITAAKMGGQWMPVDGRLLSSVSSGGAAFPLTVPVGPCLPRRFGSDVFMLTLPCFVLRAMGISDHL